MSFAELIGQATLVRTLTNAFSSGRIAHAFMLTGVRGVGKTTTARLIARALNCCADGPDRRHAAAATPAGRSPRTGTRRAGDGCRQPDRRRRHARADRRRALPPVSARYKVYIIDEVHMLSKAAFNALLKTLEEPPPDIKFIFATTEINKVPVTVLSRCQRYTLPRIPAETLVGYFGEIAEKEGVEIEPAALALVARAADGSVRDGLSILDQAIALALGARVTETGVRDMLGVADRGLVLDLFEALMRGDATESLERLEALYNGGTDPAMVLQDLLEVTHWVTRLKLERPRDPAAAAAPVADGQDRRRGLDFAARLGLAALGRTWQLLLKGLAEVQAAPQPLKAAEMALVRLIYVSDLPPPGDILRLLQDGKLAAGAAARPADPTGPGPRGEQAPARLASIGGGPVAAATPPPLPPPPCPRASPS